MISGLFNLFKYYLKFYGFRSILSFIDRILRSLFSFKIYKYICLTLIKNKFFKKKNIFFKKHSSLKNFEKLSFNYKKNIINVADEIINKNFDFLGTGKINWGEGFSWNYDIKSNYRWEHSFYSSYSQSDLMPGNGIDIKIPWELNRLHHLVALAQAYRLSNDNKYLNECIKQIKDWQKNNPLCYGINWTSTMEVSIRAVNLIVILNIIFDSNECTSIDKNCIMDIIIEHGFFIVNNLEIGIGSSKLVAGNHYLANISALSIIGMSFEGFVDSIYWQKVGVKSLEDAMKWMVNGEGFYFESSTSYHRYALELFLYPYIFAKSFQLKFSKNYSRKLKSMADIISDIKTPNDTIPQIGDNDDGRLLILNYPDKNNINNFNYISDMCSLIFKNDSKVFSNDLFWFQNLKYDNYYNDDPINKINKTISVKSFSNSGLYIIKNKRQKDYMLVKGVDKNKLALKAHSHNDALAFELWLSGKRLIVDPGTFCYTSDPILRNRFRSSSSHNSLIINNKELNEIGRSLFAIDWNTKSRCLKLDSSISKAEMLFEHNGYYDDLNILINRSIIYNKKSWLINDKIIGNFDRVKTASSLLIFPPEVKNILEISDNEFSVENFAKIKCNNSESKLIPNALYSESYGVLTKTLGLKISLHRKYNFSGSIEISRM